MAAANTGKDNKSKTVVTNIVQQNKDIENILHLFTFMLNRVVIKFKDLKILDTLAKCKEKIAQSKAALECAKFLDKGGYTVHLVLTLLSIIELIKRKNRAGGKSQKLMLLRRGKAISGLLTIKGNSQFPNLPTIMGITKKKIITNA